MKYRKQLRKGNNLPADYLRESKMNKEAEDRQQMSN